MIGKIRLDIYEFTYKLDLTIPEELKNKEVRLVVEDDIYNEKFIIDAGLYGECEVLKIEDSEYAVRESFIKAIKNRDLKKNNLWYAYKGKEDKFYQIDLDGCIYSPLEIVEVRDLELDRIKKLEKATYGVFKTFESLDALKEKIEKTIKDDTEILKLYDDISESWGTIYVETELEKDITINYDITIDNEIEVTEIY